MKGPRSRTRFVTWRMWQCSVCGKRGWSAGAVGQRRCSCADPGPWMCLVEAAPRPRRRPDPAPPAEASPPPEPLTPRDALP